MKLKVKTISDTQAELNIHNTPEEVDEALEAVFQNAHHKLSLPGFRKGKVPIDVARKHLENHIIEEAAHKLLSQNITKFLTEKPSPLPYDIPSMRTEKFEKNKDAHFVGVYDLYPTVKLGNYKNLKVEEKQVSIDEKSLERILQEIQEKNSFFKNREDNSIRKDDLLIVNICIKNEKKTLLERDNFELSLEKNSPLDWLQKDILEMSVGEKKNFNSQLPDHLLDKQKGKEDAESKKNDINVNLEILEARYKILPDLDDEFAKDMGEFDTISDFKLDVKKNLEENSQNMQKEKAKNTLLEELIKNSKISIAENIQKNEYKGRLNHFIHNVAKRELHRELSPKELDKIKGDIPEDVKKDIEDQSIKALSHHFVIEELAKTLNINITDDEIKDWLGQEHNHEPHTENLNTSPQKIEEAKFTLLKTKVLDWLYSHAKVDKSKQIAFSDLESAYKKKDT